jgi:hypothetical protein
VTIVKDEPFLSGRAGCILSYLFFALALALTFFV